MIYYALYLIFLLALGVYCRRRYTRFSDCKVKHFQTVPLLGNTSMLMFQTTNIMYLINRLYKRFPEERFVGYFKFMKPVIYVRDLELIRIISGADSDHFADHQPAENDPLLSSLLFTLKGEDSTTTRTTMSPTFTSSKIKELMPFLLEATQRTISSLKQKIEDTGRNSIEIDARGLSLRYANDVLASCVFGGNIDSVAEPNNAFYNNRSKASNCGVISLLKVLGYHTMPWLIKKLSVSLFPKKSKEYFDNLVVHTIKERETLNIVRRDIIHFITENKKVRTDIDLLAQTIVSFFTSLETTSTAKTFLLYELAVNPHVQEKLRQEIEAHEKAHNYNPDCNSIMEMTYMDMVVSELLRLWPPGITLDRVCVKEYNLGKPNAKSTHDYIIKAGECISVPICSIHHDPVYFPDPQVFDPERFSKEIRDKIRPYTYMPFGVGVANCIGSQWTLIMMKVFLFHLLPHLVIVPSIRTTFSPMLQPGYSMKMLRGHWLQLKLRTQFE